jgi:hypothetical protein
VDDGADLAGAVLGAASVPTYLSQRDVSSYDDPRPESEEFLSRPKPGLAVRRDHGKPCCVVSAKDFKSPTKAQLLRPRFGQPSC